MKSGDRPERSAGEPPPVSSTLDTLLVQAARAPNVYPLPLPGQSIAGKYVIEQLLGRGGMGAVYVARQEQLERRVAIKFMLPEAMINPAAVARFEREARAAAALQSDHATKVLDVGHLDGGPPFIVMELLTGEDLASMLKRRGPLPIDEVIEFIVQACDAIGDAHAIGVVHRDVKPANLFLARRPNGTTTIKVLDFGISKELQAGVSITSSASLVGSPLYAPPEQLREARTVDGRADIWALGVTLYELLTGNPPFTAQALAEVWSQILHGSPAPPSASRAGIPASLDAVVMRCLRKEPAERFGTAGELASALQAVRAAGAAVGRPHPVSTPAPAAPHVPPVPRPAPLPPQATVTADAVSSTHTHRSAPSRKWGALLVAVASASMIAVAAAAVWGARSARALLWPQRPVPAASVNPSHSPSQSAPPVAASGETARPLTSSAPLGSAPSVSPLGDASAPAASRIGPPNRPSSSAAPHGAPNPPAAGPRPNAPNAYDYNHM